GPLVLVVEDDPAAAELLTRQLVDAGYRTQVARTGIDALDKARRLQPAAITLDIILPEVDGWEVITRLKSDEATSGIPIVVVSVVDNPELGISLGAIDYFVKPVDAKLLINRLNRFHLERSPGQDEVRVLVVDDEPANRAWLAKTLEPAGFTVVPASGGREAIQLAKSTRPDFILLDLMMPEVTGVEVVGSASEALNRITQSRPDLILMDVQLPGQDGLSLTRELKRNPATASIPVVALTAHAMSGDRELALRAGCAGYIAKPIETRTFGAVVAQFLRAAGGERRVAAK